ncbi:MAG: DnaJ domain-containing protein [Clostridia bacterium]|nr:DnaJ domain-containing protein [Clostridia bacterium]
MTYYEILEVSESASPEVINMTYTALTFKYHPNQNNGDKNVAEEKIKQINEAYHILCNSEERARYDASLHNERSSQNANQPKKDKQQMEKKSPSLKRSTITVSLLLLLALILDVFGYVLAYIDGAFPLDYALFCAFLDFIIFTFLHLCFPLLIGFTKKVCSQKFIETISWISSLSIVVFLNALTDPSSGIAWFQALIYAIVSKHILFQAHLNMRRRKTRVVVACIVLLAFLFNLAVGLMGFVSIQNNANVITKKPQNSSVYYIRDEHLETKEPSTYHVDINGNVSRIEYASYYMDENGNLIRIN